MIVSTDWRMCRRNGRTLLTAASLLAMSSLSADARTIDDVKLDAQVLAAQCSRIDGEFAISMQARTHYATVEKNPPILFKPPTRKAYQSFACGDAKSTLYYYEYASKAELEKAKGFTEGVIWGEGGRSKEHPELIISVDNVLVIISSREPEFFKKYLEKQK